MNRGSSFLPDLVPIPDTASMRPRFMNRGSGGLLFESGGLILASMRPRFMNRGSPCALRPRCSRNSRFNEAPIHESGKW